MRRQPAALEAARREARLISAYLENAGLCFHNANLYTVLTPNGHVRKKTLSTNGEEIENGQAYIKKSGLYYLKEDGTVEFRLRLFNDRSASGDSLYTQAEREKRQKEIDQFWSNIHGLQNVLDIWSEKDESVLVLTADGKYIEYTTQGKSSEKANRFSEGEWGSYIAPCDADERLESGDEVQACRSANTNERNAVLLRSGRFSPEGPRAEDLAKSPQMRNILMFVKAKKDLCALRLD